MRISKPSLQVLREIGLGPLALLGLYRIKRKSGWLKLRSPVSDWASRDLRKHLLPQFALHPENTYLHARERINTQFFFDPDADLSKDLAAILGNEKNELNRQAKEILSGKFRFFNFSLVDLGYPPAWDTLRNLDDHHSSLKIKFDRHWSAYSTSDFPGDIKLLWEISRFGWVYILARAYRLNKQDEYFEGFWKLLISWRSANRPNEGPNWISAQEVAIRLLALIFAWNAFYPELRKVPERLLLLADMIANHAQRIPHTLEYSRAQGNNHLITEAVGLYSVGLLFPEFRRAAQWKKQGRHWVERAIDVQIFADGGYVQHSANYHRHALYALLWAFQLAKLNLEPFSTRCADLLRKSSELLRQMTDPLSGSASNYGHNDGSHLFPLSTAPHRDFRPLLQFAHYVLRGRSAYTAGAWDEAGFWLGVPASEFSDREHAGSENDNRQPKKQLQAQHPRIYPHAGLVFMKSTTSWAMLRCAHFSSRPGHSDQLHLDLWWGGENIILDAGTYLYNGPMPWQNGLAAANVHNGMLVDELEPMQRRGRFLWLHWAQGRFLESKSTPSGQMQVVVAEHDGYAKIGVLAKRTLIRAGNNLWTVVDELTGIGEHSLRVGWLLRDGKWEIEGTILHYESTAGNVRLDFSGPDITYAMFRAGQRLAGELRVKSEGLLGWFSPSYSVKQPALFLAIAINGKAPLRMISKWSLGSADPSNFEIRLDTPSNGKSQAIYREEHLDF